MTSPIEKRSVVLRGQKTSISLEEPFWQELRDVAEGRHISISALVAEVDDQRKNANLSSALRVYIFENIKSKLRAAR